jgi:hypothetical protein
MNKDAVIWYKTPYGVEAQCKHCHADAVWVECEDCGGSGYTHHDCGEDTCCCLNPEDNVECDTCDGEGGWYNCQNCDKWNCTCEEYIQTSKEKLEVAAKLETQKKLTNN